MQNLNSTNTSSSFFAASATAFVLVFLSFFYWRQRRHSYWRRHHLPFIEPTLLLGNLKALLSLRTSFGDFFRQLYESGAAAAAPVIGVFWFHTPALIIRDTKLIRRILIKDSNLFLNRYEAADALHDSWGALTLPLAKYPIWRESRRRMAEFFTSGQIKQRMYPLMCLMCLELEQHIAQRCVSSINAAHIEVKELCALYTTDVTCLVAFSISAGSLSGNLKIRQAIEDLLQPSPMKAFNFLLHFFLPRWTSWLNAKVFPKKYKKFIRELLTENLEHRRTYLNINSNDKEYHDDLIELLLKFQVEARLKKFEFAYSFDFLAAQVAIMLIAGFETSSSLMAFILYELAKQPNLQIQLRRELSQHFRKVNNVHKTLEYAELQSLNYLNMVVAEGLRMYPTAAFINREYTPDAVMLNQKGYSLRPFVNFDMPAGMPAYISILGLQRDEKYWPSPQHFEPARFSPEKLHRIEPGSYIPFGAGPHGCIGSRLGVLQVKLGLAHILKDFSVEFSATTPRRIIFEPKSFMLQHKGGIQLKFVRIDHSSN